MTKTMTINDIPKVSAETICEDVTFVRSPFGSARYIGDSLIRDCIFRNCEFKELSINGFGSRIIDCIFENCTFGFQAACACFFIHCTFRNCTFSGCFKSAFGLLTTFLECNYDDSFLESLSKEMVCPSSGEFVGWKKAYLCKCLNDSVAIKMYPVIVKLLIPSESRRSSALSNKCRCEKAMVLEVQTEDGRKIDIPEDCFVASIFEFKVENARMNIVDRRAILKYVNTEDESLSVMRFLKTKYVPDEMVYANEFNPDPLVECGGGIHFFMTREEACEYIFR